MLYYRFFKVQTTEKIPLVAASEVRMGVHLVLVNILICHRGEYTLVLDFHQRNLSRRSHPEVFCKIDVLRNFPKFTWKKTKKVTWDGWFSFEFCKISKNTFSYRIPLVAASVFHTVNRKRMYIAFGKTDLSIAFIQASLLSFFFFRSSRPEVFCKKGVLRNFTKFIGKHLCQRLFFNKVASLRPATSLKKSLWHRCFTVNIVKFLRTPFLTEPLQLLLLSFG